MVHEKTERFLLVPLVGNPVDALFGYNIRKIAFLRNRIIVHFYEAGVIVVSLPRHDFPIVKSGGKTLQMPFSYQGSLITCFLEELGHCLLRAVEHTVGVIIEAIGMAVFPVSIQARLGPDREFATKLFTNFTPSLAMRSRLGVST